MTAYTPYIIYTGVVYLLFGAWWWWRTRYLKIHSTQNADFTLQDFYQAMAKPLAHLYILQVAGFGVISHLVAGANVQGVWGYIMLVCSALGLALIFQVCLVFPWHRRLAAEKLDDYLRYLMTYVRFSLALSSPFFFYQVLSSTLFDAAVGGADPFETLILNVGRIVILSLLTIVFSVVFMMKMIPNSSVKEEEYLNLIQKRLAQAGLSSCRLRWIDIPDFNNAFVVGFRWFGFSNQTMFIGSSLKQLLTKDEFDAVICHELGHIANGHLLKRVTYGAALFLGLIVTLVMASLLSFVVSSIVGSHPTESILIFAASFLVSIIAGYILIFSLLFKVYRQQEHEADEFAVVQLGIKLSDLEMSLKKVTRKFQEHRRGHQFHFLKSHPAIYERIDHVKVQLDPTREHDWNPSVISRLLEVSVRFASPRALAVAFCVCVVTGLWAFNTIRENEMYNRMVVSASSAELEKFPHHRNVVNNRHYIWFGRTPLELAAWHRDLHVVRLLVQKGADPEKGSAFSSPIDIAIEKGHWEIVDYLLGKVGDGYLKSNASRLFAHAIQRDNPEPLELLVAHRMSRFLPAKSMSALMERALAQRSLAKVEALLKAGGRLPAGEEKWFKSARKSSSEANRAPASQSNK